MFHRLFRDVSKILSEIFRYVSELFQRCFRGCSEIFMDSWKLFRILQIFSGIVQRLFRVLFRDVSKMFGGVFSDIFSDFSEILVFHKGVRYGYNKALSIFHDIWIFPIYILHVNVQRLSMGAFQWFSTEFQRLFRHIPEILQRWFSEVCMISAKQKHCLFGIRYSCFDDPARPFQTEPIV